MKKYKWNRYKNMISFVFEVLFVVILAYIFVSYFGLRVSNAGDSMTPVIKNGDVVLVNRILYDAKSPKRGDVVAFKPKGNKHAHYDIKRIVGMPGESVRIEKGKVYINGFELKEKYRTKKIKDPGQVEETLRLKADEYFVLGDNAQMSRDSRDANYGTVRKKYLTGRAWIVVSPVKELHLIPQGE